MKSRFAEFSFVLLKVVLPESHAVCAWVGVDVGCVVVHVRVILQGSMLDRKVQLEMAQLYAYLCIVDKMLTLETVPVCSRIIAF